MQPSTSSDSTSADSSLSSCTTTSSSSASFKLEEEEEKQRSKQDLPSSELARRLNEPRRQQRRDIYSDSEDEEDEEEEEEEEEEDVPYRLVRVGCKYTTAEQQQQERQREQENEKEQQKTNGNKVKDKAIYAQLHEQISAMQKARQQQQQLKQEQKQLGQEQQQQQHPHHIDPETSADTFAVLAAERTNRNQQNAIIFVRLPADALYLCFDFLDAHTILNCFGASCHTANKMCNSGWYWRARWLRYVATESCGPWVLRTKTNGDCSDDAKSHVPTVPMCHAVCVSNGPCIKGSSHYTAAADDASDSDQRVVEVIRRSLLDDTEDPVEEVIRRAPIETVMVQQAVKTDQDEEASSPASSSSQQKKFPLSQISDAAMTSDECKRAVYYLSDGWRTARVTSRVFAMRDWCDGHADPPSYDMRRAAHRNFVTEFAVSFATCYNVPGLPSTNDILQPDDKDFDDMQRRCGFFDGTIVKRQLLTSKTLFPTYREIPNDEDDDDDDDDAAEDSEEKKKPRKLCVLVPGSRRVETLYPLDVVEFYHFLLRHTFLTNINFHVWDIEEKAAVCSRILSPSGGSIEMRVFYSHREGGHPRLHCKMVYMASQLPLDDLPTVFNDNPFAPETLLEFGFGRVEVDIKPNFQVKAIKCIRETLQLPSNFPLPLLWNVLAHASGLLRRLCDHGASLEMYYNALNLRKAFENAAKKVEEEEAK